MSETALMPPGTVSEETAETLNKIFVPLHEEARALIVESSTLTISDATEVSKMKLARVNRLKLRKLRCHIENRRVELKNESLRTGRAIDAAAAKLTALIEPAEQHCLEIEEYAERIEQDRIKALIQSRAEALAPMGTNLAPYNLGAMSEDDFDALHFREKMAFNERQAAAKKAEAERIAKEKAEAAEQKRIKAENARLKAEADAREAAIRKEREEAAAKAAELAKLAAAEQKRIQAEADAKIAAEQEATRKREQEERAKVAAESAKVQAAHDAAQAKVKLEMQAAADKAAAHAKKQRDAAEAKAKVEREAREKAEAELAAKKRAEEEAEAAKRKAAEDAAKAPDREKLQALVAALDAVTIPLMASKPGAEIAVDFSSRLSQLAGWLQTRIEKL